MFNSCYKYFLDHQSFRYSNSEEIRQTAIFDYRYHGRGIDIFQEKSGTGQARHRASILWNVLG